MSKFHMSFTNNRNSALSCINILDDSDYLVANYYFTGLVVIHSNSLSLLDLKVVLKMIEHLKPIYKQLILQ